MRPNRLPAAVAATVAIAAGATVAEHNHVPPFPAVETAIADVGGFVGDRAGDIVEVVQDNVENPKVTITESGGTEHTTFRALELKEVEPLGDPAAAALGIFTLLAIRRRLFKKRAH